jgi:hypothetical protein
MPVEAPQAAWDAAGRAQQAEEINFEATLTFGGLTPQKERPSVREVSLASEPREPADLPADSATLKHSALHEILRVTRTILPRARAW